MGIGGGDVDHYSSDGSVPFGMEDHTTDEEEATPDATNDPFASEEGNRLGEDDSGFSSSSTTKEKHSGRGLTTITHACRPRPVIAPSGDR